MRDVKSRVLSGLALGLSLSLSSEIWKRYEECISQVERKTNHLKRLLSCLEEMRRDHEWEEMAELWGKYSGKKKESASSEPGQFASASLLPYEEPKLRRERRLMEVMELIEAVKEERKEHLASFKHMWLLQGQSSSSYQLRSFYHPSFEPSYRETYPPREARRREASRASVIVPILSQPSPPPPPECDHKDLASKGELIPHKILQQSVYGGITMLVHHRGLVPNYQLGCLEKLCTFALLSKIADRF